MAQVDTDALLQAAINPQNDYGDQRINIALRRAAIARQLSSLPVDHRGRTNRGQLASLQAELGGLNSSERQIAAQERYDRENAALRVNAAFRNAHLATLANKDARDTQTANEVANIQNGVVQLQSQYPNRIFDSDQAAKFHAGMEKLTTDNAMGMRNQSTSAMVRQATEFHDQERSKAIDKSAAKLSLLGVTPQDFINRDHSKDFLTGQKTLADINKLSPTAAQGKPGSAGSDTGDYAHFMIGSHQHLVKKEDFAQWNAMFRPQQPVGEVSMATPTTPPQTGGIQPIVPTYGGQGAPPSGALVRNPDGSISPIVPTYGGEGAAPPGALVRTGVSEPGTPPPTSVPKEQQIITSSQNQIAGGRVLMQNEVAPSVQSPTTAALAPLPNAAVTPAATPHPMEGQTVRNKQTGAMGVITNGQFVPSDQQ